MSRAGELRRRVRWPIVGLQSQDGVPLAPMWLALGGTLALAVVIAALVTFLGLRALHCREFQPEPRLSAASLYDLLKVAFAVAAGVGGVVALVTAYRRQRVAEFAQDLATRTEERETARLFNERFATAAGQLGDDRPAVRLAGVYAMAGLADDWAQQRQVCVDVLCAFLRMPFEPDPGGDAPREDRQAFRAVREVRHTVIRVITDHLQSDDRRAASAQDWRGLNLDFRGATFDGGSFADAEFSGGTVNFSRARFTGGTVDFSGARFTGGTVDFSYARFTGGTVYFSYARFSVGTVDFGAEFSGGTVEFSCARFSGGTVDFRRARFPGGTVYVFFRDASFSGGTVSFGAEFSGGTIDFSGARFSGGTVDFSRARFIGGTIDFSRAGFSGGIVDFRDARGPVPPSLPDWGNDPPPGVFPPPRA